MNPNDTIFYTRTDLNYEGVTTSHTTTRKNFEHMEKWDGRYLVERCSEKRYRRVQSEMFGREYDAGIQKKYNVGPNWRENRWFVEQVRPTYP